MAATSIALSGGGHRATLFGLGVLLYLADAEKNRDVVSITSVSGGSITNGYTAQTIDYSSCDAEQFTEQVAAPLAGQVAQRGTLFVPWTSKLYLVLVGLFVLATLVIPWLLPLATYWRVLVFVAGVLWCAWLIAQRGKMCGLAYRRVLFSPDGHVTKLVDIRRAVSHVICATDMRTARQVFFSPKFVYGYSFGWSPPERVRLSDAVLASACFPGGFPPLRLSTKGMTFRGTKDDQPRSVPAKLVLVDGGVYDNMADQWARGFNDRVNRWPALPTLETTPQTLIVVNASGRRDWRPFSQQLPIWGEVAALQRDMDIMYENTTAVRRQDLVDRFDQAQIAGEGLRGGLVMIKQSPFHIPNLFTKGKLKDQSPDRTARAQAVLTAFAGENEQEWERITSQDARVATTLRALGTEVSMNLLRHAYLLAMANLHVLLDFPLLPVPAESHFESLARGEVPAD